jgi:hypothetical protein
MKISTRLKPVSLMLALSRTGVPATTRCGWVGLMNDYFNSAGAAMNVTLRCV